MGFLTFFGRVLIVTAIVSSAYYHLEHPENSINEFKDNYATIDALSNQYLKFDIPLDQTNWKIAAKIFGVFEALVVLLIVLGDGLGGVLYVLTIIAQIFFLAWGKFTAGTINNWTHPQLQELSKFVALFGIALILSCSGCKKNANN